jgi:large subunit ribosomal protein L25
MENIQLNAKTRKKLGRNAKKLRREGVVPAILYGHKIKNINIKVDERDFEEVFKKAGESTLIDLKIISQDGKGEVRKVLVHGAQRDPVKGNFLHIDFYQVKMTEKITTEVVLNFVGESLAVKNFGGILIKNSDKIQIECLPQDLIRDIEVDVSKIENLEESICVKDLSVPKSVNILANPEEQVATVIPPSVQEEEEKEEEERKAEDVEEVKAEEKESDEEDKKEKDEGKKEKSKKDKK